MTSSGVSELQIKLLASIPFVAAPLSFLGSWTILFIIVSKRGGKNTNPTYLRLMIGICTYDILMTTWTMMGPIPVPKADAPNSIARLAHGTMTSCTAQGFFMYLGAIGTLFYNCSLMGYYLASIVFEYCSQDLVKLELYLHIISIGIPLFVNGMGLYLQIFNPTLSGQRCGITAYPPGCARDPSIPCTRGVDFDLYVTYAMSVPCMVGLLVILNCLLWIYVISRRRSLIISTVPSQPKDNAVIKILRRLHLREQPNGMESQSNDSMLSIRSDTIRVGQSRHHPQRHRTHNQPKYVRAVAIQSMVYALVFFNTYFWVFVRFFIRKSKNPVLVYSIRLLAELLLPLQGFCNAITFLRPRYNNIKKHHKDKSILWMIKESILATPQVLPSSRRRKNNKLGSSSFRVGATSASAVRPSASGLVSSSRGSRYLHPHLEVSNLNNHKISQDVLHGADTIQSQPLSQGELMKGEQDAELSTVSKSNINDHRDDGESSSGTPSDCYCESNNQENLVVVTVCEEGHQEAQASSSSSLSRYDCNLKGDQSQTSNQTNIMQDDDSCSGEVSDEEYTA